MAQLKCEVKHNVAGYLNEFNREAEGIESKCDSNETIFSQFQPLNLSKTSLFLIECERLSTEIIINC